MIRGREAEAAAPGQDLSQIRVGSSWILWGLAGRDGAFHPLGAMGGSEQSQGQAGNWFSFLIPKHLPLLSCRNISGYCLCSLRQSLASQPLYWTTLYCFLWYFHQQKNPSDSGICHTRLKQEQNKTPLAPMDGFFPSVPWIIVRAFYVKLVQFCSFFPHHDTSQEILIIHYHLGQELFQNTSLLWNRSQFSREMEIN